MISKWIKNLKLGMGLLRYSLQIKTNLTMLILFSLMGVLYEVLQQGKSFFGIYFLALVPLYLSQLLNAVFITGLAQSSNKKHAILVDIPALFSFVWTTVTYLFLILLRFLYYKTSGQLPKLAMLGLLYFGLILIFMTIYNVFVFRKPWLGYLFLAILIFALSFTGGLSMRLEDANMGYVIAQKLLNLSLFDHPALLTMIGYMLVVANALVFYLLSNLLYKMPLSERTYKQALSRAKQK